MNKKKYLVIILTMIPMLGFSQQKLKLAVLDPVVTGEKITEALKISVREIISGTFINYADNYSIVERSLLDKVMQEVKFLNSDTVDESQAIQLGKLVGADRIVLTVISRFESRCMISIKWINVETATIDRQLSKMVNFNSILDVAEPLTLVLLGKGDGNLSAFTTSAAPISQPTPTTQKQSATPKSATSSSVTSDFKGCGVTLNPVGFIVGHQPQEMPIINMERIRGNNTFNVIIDLSEANVAGFDFSDFVKNRLNPEIIDDFHPELKRLIDGLNEMDGYRFAYSPTSLVSLLVKVREVDEDGRVNTSDFVFVDTKTYEVLSGVRITSEGGLHGSFPNLMGDAFEEDAAEKFIKQFKLAIKKSKRIK